MEINPTSDALLIVDVQPDFMPGGGLPVREGDLIVKPIAQLLARNLFATVVATQDWHPREHISFASTHAGCKPFETIELYDHEQILWPDHCVQGTDGAALHPDLPVEPLSAIVRKGQARHIDSYSGFRDNHGPEKERLETGLSGYLKTRKIKRVILCGLALDVCVAWTALDAVAMGFETTVIRDLCRPVTQEGEHKALEQMKQAGIIVITSDDLRGEK